MDNTNDLSQSIFQPSSTSVSSMGDTSSSSSTGGVFSGISNMSITTWLLVILILAFLGFNIFVYLAQGTQAVADIFGPLVKKVFGTTLAVTGEVIDVSTEGAKKVVGGTANVIEKSLTAIQDITPNASVAPSKVKGEPVSEQPNVQNNITQDQSTLNRALNTAKSQQPQQQDYHAYEATTSVHNAGKAGWCYIGQDRGFRSCAQVGANDTCMSGDIFPSHEICMNPNLRH